LKTLSLLTLFTACALLNPLVFANDLTELKGCAAKKHHLQTLIEQARMRGNSHQQAGLETALNEVNANCTDESLRQARENKIKVAEDEVRERRDDLEAAIKKGDADKISKRRAKLDESRSELQSAHDELGK
jgi:division protein CdvB (Snf7/Vps24/ESCRT-III family)